MQQFVFARLSIMMFLQFFIWGAWYVTVGNYMKSHGMFDDVGWAYTVGPIAAIISPFFLGIIADRFFNSERVLGVLHFLGGFAILAAPFAAAAGSNLFILLLGLHMLCYMPTLGLTNTLAFHHMENQEKQFPLIRVFGTIGWIAANWVVSSLFEADSSEMQFYVTAVACFLFAGFSFFLPSTPPPAKGKQVSLGEIMGLDALKLLLQPSFAVFILCSFLICIPLAAYYAYAPIYAGKIGFTEIATTLSFGQISEIVFMLLMPMFFARLGVKKMLAIGMAAWVVRYGLFGAADTDQIKWMVLAGILLHGICYDFFFVTGFIYTDKQCDPKIRGQAQGLLVLITQGLGLGIGAQVIQRLVSAYTPEAAAELQSKSTDAARAAFAATDPAKVEELTKEATSLANQANELIDWQSIWYAPCIAAGVILLLFLVLFRDPKKGDAVTATDDSGSETTNQPES